LESLVNCSTKWLFCAAFFAIGCANVFADTFGPPVATVTVDGGAPISIDADWQWYDGSEGGKPSWYMDGPWESPDGTLKFSGLFEPDPFISYTFAATDVGAPSTFSFTMTMPIATTGSPNVVDSSISGGLTDGSANNGQAITPAPALGDPDGDTISEMQIAEVSTTGGAGTYVNMGVDVGPAFSDPAGPPNSPSYGPPAGFSAGPQTGPVGTWNFMRIRLSFSLAGGGDSAALTGRATIEETGDIPEPSSLVLGLIASSLMGLYYRRSRRTA